MAFDVAGEFAKAARDGGIEIGKDAASRSVADNSNLLVDAQRQIEVLSRRLARDLSPSKSAQMMRRLDRSETSAAAASQALKGASAAKSVLTRIPIVFAALDIYSAAKDLREEW